MRLPQACGVAHSLHTFDTSGKGLGGCWDPIAGRGPHGWAASCHRPRHPACCERGFVPTSMRPVKARELDRDGRSKSDALERTEECTHMNRHSYWPECTICEPCVHGFTRPSALDAASEYQAACSFPSQCFRTADKQSTCSASPHRAHPRSGCSTTGAPIRPHTGQAAPFSPYPHPHLTSDGRTDISHTHACAGVPTLAPTLSDAARLAWPSRWP
jgi:hypothetical protein